MLNDTNSTPTIILDKIQEDALERLKANNRYCLFWDVGVGKTYPVLSRLSLFKNKKILILAPAVVVEGMWENERQKDYFDVFDQNDVEIRSYEWLAWAKYDIVGKRRKKVANNVSNLKHDEYDVIILDEAHRIATSDRQSNTSKIIKKLQKTAEYVYCLTGTPAKNGYQDLYHIFKNIGVSPWGEEWDYDSWVRYYFIGFNLKLPHTTIFKPTHLKPNLTKSFMDYLYLHSFFAEKVRTWGYKEITISIPNPKKTPEYHKALRGVLTDALGQEVTTNKLVGFGKAYMILNGFEYVLQPDGDNRATVYFENPKFAPIERAIKHELLRNNEKSVVVAYNFKHDYTFLKENLIAKGYKVVDNIDDAEACKEKFVYLIQLKKGIGINLQHLSCVMMFYTYNFSFVDFNQTIGRIDRRGQLRDVRIYFFVLEKTIESDVVLKAIFTKQKVDKVLKSKSMIRSLEKEVTRNGY